VRFGKDFYGILVSFTFQLISMQVLSRARSEKVDLRVLKFSAL
jgi:hypothetical protein